MQHRLSIFLNSGCSVIVACLVKLERQLKTETGQLRKESEHVDGILKETILQVGSSDEVDDRDRNVFGLFD